MPAKKGYGRRRAGGKKVLGRRRKVYRRAFRPARGVPEWASCTESVSLANITGVANYTMNQMYALNNTNLTQYINRALPISQNYQHYRIKRIKLEFIPQMDTFQNTAGAVGTGLLVPSFYYMLNKSGSVPPNPTPDNLRSMGAKPIRFDEKVITVAWRPSVLQENQGVLGDVGSGYKISPWLSTQVQTAPPGPSSVQHLGIYWVVARPGILPAGIVELTYDIKITVEFQFKKPLVKVNAGQPNAIEFGHQVTA